MIDEKIIRELGGKLAAATKRMAEDIAAGDVGDEDDITGQLIGSWKTVVNDYKPEGVRFSFTSDPESESEQRPIRLKGRRLTSRGSGAEESLIGADLVLVLDYNFHDYAISKGVLVQSKILDPSLGLQRKGDRDKLLVQCANMTSYSAASFVATYSPAQIEFFSATSVLAAGATSFGKILNYPPSIFFQDFLQCWIGDCNMQATDRESLRFLREMTGARNAALISATDFG